MTEDDKPIEDRLRACAIQHSRGNKTAEIPKRWLTEAADEIVRLRADVESLVAREQDD